MAVTLEKNIVELDPDNFYNSKNIRQNYAVTEKTDGDRNLLFIDSNGEFYLINRQNEIKKTGVRSTNLTNCLLDGELVSKNLNGQDIKLYLTFDLYFSK